MDFRFLEVKENELLDKVLAFRYKIINETASFQIYAQKNNFPDKKESDIYDPYSVHFVALNEDDEVCATVRLIYNSAEGYPLENCMKFDNTSFERDKLGELSRIFIDAKYRSMQTTKSIIHHLNKLIYIKMMELGIEYTYGALEPKFLRLLKMFKMNYEVLAEKQMHGQMGLRYPCILYTRRLGFDNPEFIVLWKERHAS